MGRTYEERLAQCQKELSNAKRPDIQMSFKVMTMNDERVCPSCKKHEGVKVDDVYDAVIGVNHPPFHKDCRCIATYCIEKVRSREEQEAISSRYSE